MPVAEGRVWCALVAVIAATVLARPVSAQTEIRFTLDGPIEGPQAPLFVAQDAGYLHTHRLTVRSEPASGVLEPITRVASGEFQMGIADFNALIRWRDQNPATPISAVFIVFNRAPYSIIARRSRGIAVPKDLEGKRLAAPTASASGAQWPLFARLNGIDADKVKLERVSLAVRNPMLASGQIDAITAVAFRGYIDLKDRGVPVNDLLLWRMADFGLRLYGNAIIVGGKFAAENPKAVAGFLDAYLRGLKDTVKNPSAAVGAVLQRDDALRKDVELERLRMAIREDILTPEVLAQDYGNVDPARLQAALDQLELTYKFKVKPSPAQAFDATFLPPAAARKVN
jgi:NitT/TauT family transport system substrate-binding protein